MARETDGTGNKSEVQITNIKSNPKSKYKNLSFEFWV